MEPMTPEERFTKIENLLATLTETQLRHETAIRDLIVISRTTLNSIGELREAQKGFQEAQKLTDDKLHILIETVDRIIRNQQK
jgi:hypothetical protein